MTSHSVLGMSEPTTGAAAQNGLAPQNVPEHSNGPILQNGPLSSNDTTPRNRPASTNESSKIVAFDGEASHQDSGPDDQSHQWISNYNRKETMLDRGNIEARAFRHQYIFRRPHALQYYHPDTDPLPSAPAVVSRMTTRDSSNSGNSGREWRTGGDYIKQLTRLELFIDLIWVGIIANLSSTYGEQAFSAESGISPGEAVGEFILLFLPIWRMWDYLREYCSNYYQDDFMQRNFVVWILLLCVLYGVNAPYAFLPGEEPSSLTILISLYLIARGSFLLAYIIQAAYSPFLMRKVLFQIGTTITVAGLWIAAIFVPFPGKLGLLIVANGLEQPISFFLASPAGDTLVTGGWVRHMHIEHYIERHEGFFIIILGEGVFRLIEGSPSGWGINKKSGTVLEALLLYYILHWLYFNGDQTKEFIHAVRRTWWKPSLWKHFHIIMYGSLLTLAAAVLFLIDNQSIFTTIAPGEQNTELTHFSVALWSASGSLSLAFFSMTCIALLNRPLDKPKTLFVNDRYLRLAPRIPAIVAIMCIPLIKNLTAQGWCGGAVTTLYVVFLWEMVAGLESGWQWFEPRAKED